ncbi:hypothetical protein HYT02_03140 [Candidatus Gottesmanbacteria bacterium]|nr:hypothetical protein [Candidatus Gottesmanbacteria bacterium]
MKRSATLKKRRIHIFLFLIFLVGLTLRLYKLNDGLIFTYDQARDAYRSTQIFTQKDFKIVGPETDIPGVHHGVGYYYLLAIPYALFQDPVAAASLIAVFNALGIFLIFWAANKFFGNLQTAVISSVLYAVSFEMVQYGKWLSNPSLAVLTVLLSFIGLWIWTTGNRRGFLLAMFGISLSLHFQLFLLYLFLVPIVIFLIYHPKISVKYIILGIIISIVIDLPLIIAEIKFGFQTIHALGHFFSSQSNVYSSVTDFLIKYIDRFISVAYHTIFPLNSVFAFFAAVFIFYVVFKNQKGKREKNPLKFLILWLFSVIPLFAFSSGALGSEFSFVGVAICFILLTAYTLNYIWEEKKKSSLALILLAILILVNLRFNLIHAKDGAYIFSIQKSMTYGIEKQILDYTYQEAKGEPFSICTLTNPLFINTTWAYLYENYGKSKYKYLPFWAGPDQSSYLGNLPDDTSKPKLRFIIYEPLTGIAVTPVELFAKFEDFVSELVEVKTFAEFKVEKRLLVTDSEKSKKIAPATSYDQNLLKDENYLQYHCFN